MQSNKPVTLMRPMDVLEALPCIPIYEGVLSQFNELSMAADQQELVSEMKMTLDPGHCGTLLSKLLSGSSLSVTRCR